MATKLKALTIALLALILIGCAKPIWVTKYPEARDISLCQLFHEQEQFQNQLVRVEGTYYSAFEVSALRSTSCKQDAWVEFEPSAQTDSPQWAVKKLWSPNANYRGVKVRFVGKLSPPNKPFKFRDRALRLGFGHMNAYDFKFTVVAVESVG